MKITEIKKDLFTLDTNIYVFAHNISCDCAMGEGIVVPFKNRHNGLKNTCLSYAKKHDYKVLGRALKHSDEKGIVYNLFTKQYVYDNAKNLPKGKYLANLKSCLQDLKLQMIINQEKYLAIPKIGCGLDMCDWEDVKSIIKDVFKNCDIEVVVCYI